MQGLVVKVDGETEVLEFEEADFLLTAQGAVNGYIERVRLPLMNVNMWVNEDGLALQLLRNPFASELYGENFGVRRPVVGNVLFTAHMSPEGDVTGLSEVQISALKVLVTKVFK